MVRPKTGNPTSKKSKQVYAKGYPKSPSKTPRAKKALFEVENAGLSLTKAATKYDLSFSYLQRRLSGKIDIDTQNGPSPFLSTEEEAAIAHYISEMALRGMGLNPGDIMDLVQSMLKRERRKIHSRIADQVIGGITVL